MNKLAKFIIFFTATLNLQAQESIFGKEIEMDIQFLIQELDSNYSKGENYDSTFSKNGVELRYSMSENIISYQIYYNNKKIISFISTSDNLILRIKSKTILLTLDSQVIKTISLDEESSLIFLDLDFVKKKYHVKSCLGCPLDYDLSSLHINDVLDIIKKYHIGDKILGT